MNLAGHGSEAGALPDTGAIHRRRVSLVRVAALAVASRARDRVLPPLPIHGDGVDIPDGVGALNRLAARRVSLARVGPREANHRAHPPLIHGDIPGGAMDVIVHPPRRLLASLVRVDVVYQKKAVSLVGVG